jgi:hypothetical protein
MTPQSLVNNHMDALAKAIKIFGNQANLASAINKKFPGEKLSQATVARWRILGHVNIHRALQIEVVTKGRVKATHFFDKRLFEHRPYRHKKKRAPDANKNERVQRPNCDNCREPSRDQDCAA